jgi:hypothetical protein
MDNKVGSLFSSANATSSARATDPIVAMPARAVRVSILGVCSGGVPTNTSAITGEFGDKQIDASPKAGPRGVRPVFITIAFVPTRKKEKEDKKVHTKM